MKIYLGADHRGFQLKEELKQFLETNYDVEDCGAFEKIESDDYTDFAIKVAEKVSTNEGSCGIVICGAGVGVDITANKFANIRCGLALNQEQIQAGRSDDNINVLSLASDFTLFDQAREIVEVFLQTEFIPSEKHKRRLEKIAEL